MHGRLQLAPEVRELLLSASAATIDRLLRPIRQEAKSRKPRRSSNQANKKVPGGAFADWEEPQPGFFEIDFVAHCGGSMAGVFIHSLVMTDVCSGWTEALPLLAREQTLATEGLGLLGRQTPIPVLGIDSDNDSAFLNETLVSYCEKHQIEFTRSRPYRKNDQAWIEQKNGAVVRRFVGHDRFAGAVAGQAMAHLHHSVRLFVNYFQPSFKLKEKVRDGSKVKKKYFPPATPCDRLLAETRVSTEVKEALRNERSQLDPVELLHLGARLRARTAQSALASLAGGKEDGEGQVRLDDFLDQLPRLWESGEARPTHRKQSSKPRDWRTRENPFEGVWPKVLGWLEKDPDASAKALFDRLRLEHPGEFQDGQLRTLQRRVRQGRQIMAKTLVYSCLSDGAHPVKATVVGDREGAEVEAGSS